MPLELTRRGEFALLTLNRPEALNALSFQVIRDLGARLDEVAAGDARALLITGAGSKAFCAGADITELQHRTLLEQKQGAELGQRVFAKLDDLPMPSAAGSSWRSPAPSGSRLPRQRWGSRRSSSG
jgi:enoyl-CoA hydratase